MFEGSGKVRKGSKKRQLQKGHDVLREMLQDVKKEHWA
jgi:hypothetical protein